MERDLEYYLHMRQPERSWTKPFLLATVGLPGSGKTSIVKGLASLMDIKYISEDVTRKDMLGVRPHQTVSKEYYTEDWNSTVFRRICREASEYLFRCRPVVIDSVLARREQRQELMSLAKVRGAEFMFLMINAREEVILSRLKERDLSLENSDAGIGTYADLKGRYEDLGLWACRLDIESFGEPLDRAFEVMIEIYRRLKIKGGTFCENCGFPLKGTIGCIQCSK